MVKETCNRCQKPVYPTDKVGPLKDGCLFHQVSVAFGVFHYHQRITTGLLQVLHLWHTALTQELQPQQK